MDNNYFIKKNYIPNIKRDTIDTEDQIYWDKSRISQSYYTRYNLYKFCRKLIKKKNLKNVLDIGCGPALQIMKFLFPICHEIYGIDQEKIIEFCKKNYGLKTFYTDDIENSILDLNKKFDLILSFDVIEHLLNPNKLISYIKKYAHKDSYIIITTPERDLLRGKNCNSSPKDVHIREWNAYEFKNYLENQGFKILTHINGENFKLYLNFKKTISEIKKEFLTQMFKIRRFNSLKKIKHCQMVLCKLENSKNSSKENSIIQSYNRMGNKSLRDIFKIISIKVYMGLFYYQLIYKRKRFLKLHR